MVERKIVVDNLTVEYEGLFDAKELYRIINEFILEKAYTLHELKNYEQVFQEGKQIQIIKEPYRKINEYAKYVPHIEINMDGLKEVVVERHKKKVKINQGKVAVIISGYLELDYEHRWEKKALFYFLRALFDQFIFKVSTDKFEAGLIEECNHLKNIVQDYLNMKH